MTTTAMTEHTDDGSERDDRLLPRTAEQVRASVPEQHQWRFVSAVHAARALNARPATT